MKQEINTTKKPKELPMTRALCIQSKEPAVKDGVMELRVLEGMPPQSKFLKTDLRYHQIFLTFLRNFMTPGARLDKIISNKGFKKVKRKQRGCY